MSTGICTFWDQVFSEILRIESIAPEMPSSDVAIRAKLAVANQDYFDQIDANSSETINLEDQNA